MNNGLACVIMIISICAVLALCGSSAALAGVNITPLPEGMPRSASCQVTVDGELIDVIDTAVNHQRTWTSRPMLDSTPVAWFEMDGKVTVAVTFTGVDISAAVVRPLSLNIQPTIAGDIVTFELERPANITIEYNDQVKGALHLFASAPDVPPDPDTEKLIYIKPGIHDNLSLNLMSGQTVYLAPRAVLRGQIVARNVRDITIMGHGIIDGSTYDRWEDILVPINIEHCDNVIIKGITIIDPAAWTLNTYKSTDILIEDVKIIGARSNSDGITTQSCERLTVRGCFVRGWDDNLVVKGYDGDARDILFEDCVLWTDLAQSMEIGYETRADVIERVTFRNITVLHNFHKPVMSIHNSDHALVKDILFKDILVEDAQMGQGDGTPTLIELTTSKSQWSKSDVRGNIRDVVFDGVTVAAGLDRGIRIIPASKDFTIDNVVFRNFNILGRHVETAKDVKLTRTNKVGDNIAFEP